MADREGHLGILVLHVLVVVVQEHTHSFVGEPLSEHRGILGTDKEDVFLIKFAGRLLRHIKRPELLAVNELANSMDWLELRVSLEWNVLDRGNTDLQGIQLLTKIGRKEATTCRNFAFKP